MKISTPQLYKKYQALFKKFWDQHIPPPSSLKSSQPPKRQSPEKKQKHPYDNTMNSQPIVKQKPPQVLEEHKEGNQQDNHINNSHESEYQFYSKSGISSIEQKRDQNESSMSLLRNLHFSGSENQAMTIKPTSIETNGENDQQSQQIPPEYYQFSEKTAFHKKNPLLIKTQSKDTDKQPEKIIKQTNLYNFELSKQMPNDRPNDSKSSQNNLTSKPSQNSLTPKPSQQSITRNKTQQTLQIKPERNDSPEHINSNQKTLDSSSSDDHSKLKALETSFAQYRLENQQKIKSMQHQISDLKERIRLIQQQLPRLK